MQVSVETTSGLERKISIVLPADQIESAVSEKLKETARRVRIDGFRQGKVPVSVVKQRYGAGVRQEVLEDKMRNSYIDAISKEELRVAGYPKFQADAAEEGKDFEFSATVEVYPEIQLNDFSAYEIERLAAEVTDADIEEMISTLQKQRTEYSAVERASEDGDQVIIDFVGKLDGVEFDGGKAENQPLVLGSNTMIPGFEAGIVGMAAGEEKTIEVTFPEAYQNKDLAGKAATFDITVREVKAGTAPELNEDFFKAFGSNVETADEFRAEVRQNMEREADQAIRAKNKNAVIDALVKDLAFDVPSALVDDEIHNLQHDAAKQFGGNQQIDPHQLPKELFTEQADRRVRVGLIFAEIAKQHEIRADEESVKAFAEEVASVYEDPKSVVDFYMNNDEQRQQLAAAVLETKVVDTVLEKAKINEKSVDYKVAVAR